MSLTIPMPRLLPITMVAIGLLLAMKSTSFVRGLLPGGAGSSTSAMLPQAAAAVAPTPEPPIPPAQRPALKPATASPAAPPAPSPPAEKPVSEQERALLLDLRQRRTELEAREALVVAREATLAATEKRLGARIEELTTLQTRLEALETARRDREEANWRGLVKLYETMKPRDAALIFNELDKPVLLQVLDRMKDARAAAVLAAMLPDRARQATADLAHMRAQSNRAPGATPDPPAQNALAGQTSAPQKQGTP